jgi:hypothetical protein
MVPYIKFGKIEPMDLKFITKDIKTENALESIEWMHMIERGKMTLPLRHIKLIYRNEKNEIVNEIFALTHCIINGCRAVLDTKTYYFYGPASQLKVIYYFILGNFNFKSSSLFT